MEATLAVVRAYATRGQYGTAPRETPNGSPILLPDIPRVGWIVTVALGDAVPWVIEAAQLRAVISRTAFTGGFGRAQQGEDDGEVQALLADASIGPNASDGAWWVTIVCERPVEVPDDEWLGYPYVWVSPVTVDGLVQVARQELGSTLDFVAATIASNIRNVVDSRPVN